MFKKKTKSKARTYSKPKILFVRKKLKKKFNKPIRLARILLKNPVKLVIVKNARITTPRKPNSARRKTLKSYYKFRKWVLSYVPGGKHTLKQFSQTYVRGQGARDLPGIYTTAIRNTKDLEPVIHKKRRRSIYGLRKLERNQNNKKKKWKK